MPLLIWGCALRTWLIFAAALPRDEVLYDMLITPDYHTCLICFYDAWARFRRHIAPLACAGSMGNGLSIRHDAAYNVAGGGVDTMTMPG